MNGPWKSDPNPNSFPNRWTDDSNRWTDDWAAPVKKDPPFTVAPDGVSLYLELGVENIEDVNTGMAIGETLCVLGIPADTVTVETIGPHDDWLAVRFADSGQASAFRMACRLSFQTEITA